MKMSVIAIVIIYFVALNDRSSVAGANVNDKVNRKGYTALHVAVQEGDRDEVNSLIERRANVNSRSKGGNTPLHIAAKHGFMDVASILVHHGANISSTNKYGDTPLHIAVKEGQDRMVESELHLLNSKTINAVGKNGYTPLHYAVSRGDEQITDILLRNGANVHFVDDEELTPLHIAASKGSENIVNSLIDAGADTNALDGDFETPLIVATVENKIKVAETLIKRGASVNNQNGEGETALHEAIKNDNEGMVSLLMKSGANPSIRNRGGNSPIDFATNSGRSRIVDLLRQQNTGPSELDLAIKACARYLTAASDKISNGELAERGEFPWMAALGYNTSYNIIHYGCGGTIISEFFILTAAHCTKRSRQPVIVRLGTTSLSDVGSQTDEGSDENGVVIRRVHRIYQHPEYKTLEKKNDISLIRVKRPILFSDDIRPACLQIDLRDESPSVKLIVSGWGDLNDTFHNRLGLLRKTDLVTMPLSRCNTTLLEWNQEVNEKFLRNGLSESQYCAYDPNGMKDSCPGDSGGPLQLFPSGDKLPKVVGVVSWGIGCGSSLPGVYTRVAFYIKWIESIVWPNGFNTSTSVQ